MSDYFMGQIVMSGFPFAPRGFAQCNGSLLAMAQYSALFALLGLPVLGLGIAAIYAIATLAAVVEGLRQP